MSMCILYLIDKHCSRKIFISQVIYLYDKKEDYPIMRIADIRRQNARALADKEDSHAAFGAKIGMNGAQTSHIIGKNPIRKIGDSVAQRIEVAYKKPPGWMDVIHTQDVSQESLDIAKKIQELPSAEKAVILRAITSDTITNQASQLPVKSRKTTGAGAIEDAVKAAIPRESNEEGGLDYDEKSAGKRGQNHRISK